MMSEGTSNGALQKTYAECDVYIVIALLVHCVVALVGMIRVLLVVVVCKRSTLSPNLRDLSYEPADEEISIRM